MATATGAHMPALGNHEREQAGHELQATLVELVDLSLLGKQLHWCVVGPLFKPVHEHLDELVDSWRQLSDTVAERAVALGVFPDGQAPAVAQSSEIARVERGPIDEAHLVRELVARLAEVDERIRERMARLAEIDSASEDVLVEVVRELEKQLWMLRSQLPDAAR